MSVIVSQTYRPTQYAMYAKNTVPALLIEAVNETVSVQLKYWPWSDRQNANSHWNDADEVFTGSYAPDFNSEVWIDFGDLYGAFLETTMPGNSDTELNQADSIGLFRLFVAGSTTGDIQDASLQWYVFNAKLNSTTPFQTWSQQNFLTNQPIERPTNYEAKEWLTYLDLVGDYNVIGRFYPKEGGLVDCIVRSDEAVGCYSVDVSYALLIPMVARLPHQLKGYYDIILTDGELNEICRQRYIYEERSGREKYFLFVNALGGIDTMICKGENVLAPDITHNIGRFGRQYRALDDTDDMRKWTQHIGQVPNRQRNWIYELLTAKQGAEKYDPETMKYLEIVVDSSELSMSDFGQLAGSPFSYILNETENVVADTERPDRSLHQSVADQAEELHDDTKQMEIAFESDGQGGFETDDIEIPATKVYVTDPRSLSTAGESPIYYFLNGSATASGSFTPGVDANPYIIDKKEDATIRFATQNDKVGSLTINYYPVTIQNT